MSGSPAADVLDAAVGFGKRQNVLANESEGLVVAYWRAS
jgi:hypothetical protein